MEINFWDIQKWDNEYRTRFINSISGYKSTHLIGTQSGSGFTNLALFSSVTNLGGSPPLIGLIMQPHISETHTYRNILETKAYTVNHVHKSFLKQAHYTSADFPVEESEFKACHLSQERIPNFTAPFVKESKIKFGLTLKENLLIKENGARLIVGEIQHVLIDDQVTDQNGELDLEAVHDICVTGWNQYSSVSKYMRLPTAKVTELPAFNVKERADNVVFDKYNQQYNASILPYGTNIGAPRIEATGVSAWKNTSISSFNHSFQNKIESLKNAYQKLIQEYQTNEMVYHAEMNFEPIVGQTYYLYLDNNKDNKFLSLIPPSSWRMEFIGAFKLNHEKLWEKVE